MAKRRLQNGTSMAIFPEGLVPTENVVLHLIDNHSYFNVAYFTDSNNKRRILSLNLETG
jgi:hypothetical protein